MSLSPRTKLGPYEIDSVVGAGGMGEVYKAIDGRLDRTVAIKVLGAGVVADPSRRQRFEREARAVSSLSHPNICTLYDVGEQDGSPFLVMEYLEGETLALRLQRGPLPVKEAVRIGLEMADALDHAHRQRIIHRDLKPGNIMFTRDGSAKLLDFGLARLVNAELSATGVIVRDRDETLTEEGTILGTVQYMAPEQLEAREIGTRTDIFAFGGVMYEMLTGRPPFTGATKASVMAAILDKDPPALLASRDASGVDAGKVGIPALLENLVMRCLAKSPNDRWQTAADLREALRWAADPGTRQSAAARRRGARSYGTWLAALVPIVGLAAWLGYRAWTAVTPDPPPFTFPVNPPPNATFNESAASLALSPDGKYLAFVASTPGGTPVLWLRSRDTLALRALPGTEKGWQPFWSADSRYLAFGGPEGLLKKVEIASGMVQVITRVPGMQAGSWSSEDVILFTRLRPAGERGPDPPGIFRVAASGGTPERVTRPDPARAETAHTWAQFLPDGRHFLFLARSTKPEFDGVVYAGSLDSPDVVRVLAADSQAMYTPPGFLVFVRGTTLVAQRFDARRLKPEGEPMAIAEPVERNTWGFRAAFSVSSAGVLAFRPVGETELAWFDRGGRRVGVLGPPGHYRNPALSPDGALVAVERTSPDENTLDLWTIDARGVIKRLTFDQSQMPLWSVDGTHIVSRTPHNLTWRASTGGDVRNLMPRLDPFMSPLGWTPDGQSLLYEHFSLGSQEDVWTQSLAPGGKPELVLHSAFADTQAQISPDGRWMAYVSDESGGNDVYVRRYPPGDDKWIVSDAGGIEPQWSGTSELLYLAADRWLMSVAVKPGSSFSAAAPVRLFATRMSVLRNAGYTRNQYLVATDGRILINQPPPDGAPPSMTMIVNWPSLLKKGP
ncbi:MAG TPA: protein kinase [Vicinamibacterales bacterium]